MTNGAFWVASFRKRRFHNISKLERDELEAKDENRSALAALTFAAQTMNFTEIEK